MSGVPRVTSNVFPTLDTYLRVTLCVTMSEMAKVYTTSIYATCNNSSVLVR